MSFRLLLLTLVLGLIVASTVSTTWLGAAGFRSVIRSILDKQVQMTLDAVTGRVEDLFEPAGRLADSLARRIERGTLSVEKPEALAILLADSLRFESGIAWIGFGYADGRFAGAWIDGREVFVNLSWPAAGPPMEWRIRPDGSWSREDRPNLPQGFDARLRPWFQIAMESSGKAWTSPYFFATGEPGISVAQSVRGEDGHILGVITVDFLLGGIKSYLEDLKQEFRGDTLVFSIHGDLIATPKQLEQRAAINHVRELLREDSNLRSLSEGEGRLITEVDVNGETFIVGVQAADIPGGLDCVSAIIFSRQEAFGPLEATIRRSIFAALAALGVSLLAGFVLAGRIATPLGKITRQLQRIGAFDLASEQAPASSVREIMDLSGAVERMRASLASFSRYVPVELVRDLVRGGGVAEPGGERSSVVVLFCDLAGFTAYAEKTDPETAVETLTGFFENFGEAIDAQGGVIDKFLGDGIMALFDVPKPLKNAAASACRAAWNGARATGSSGAGLGVRVGIHMGDALVGNIGTSNRFAFTAIGDCVNLASRLESLNKVYGTGILVGAPVRAAAGESEFLWRIIDCASVHGRDEPLEIHELLACRGEATEQLVRIASTYESAFSAYAAREFDRARHLLEEIGSEDGPSRVLLARIEEMLEDAEHPAWQGFFPHSSK